MGAMFPICPVLPALTIQQCVVYAAALQIRLYIYNRTRINLHKNGQKMESLYLVQFIIFPILFKRGQDQARKSKQQQQ